jgi:hypothetical protein
MDATRHNAGGSDGIEWGVAPYICGIDAAMDVVSTEKSIVKFPPG